MAMTMKMVQTKENLKTLVFTAVRLGTRKKIVGNDMKMHVNILTDTKMVQTKLGLLLLNTFVPMSMKANSKLMKVKTSMKV